MTTAEPAPEWSGDLIAAARFGSPEAIRAALLPEQIEEFDDAFDAALTSARPTQRLDELRHVLLAWRRVAMLTQMDPDAHRETLSAIAEIRQPGVPRTGSVSWDELKAELGLPEPSSGSTSADRARQIFCLARSEAVSPCAGSSRRSRGRRSP